MILGYQINDDVISITTSTKVYNITPSNHPNYDRIRETLKKNDLDLAYGLLDLEAAVLKFGDGKLQVIDGTVLYMERNISGVLEDYILRMIEEGFDVQPLVAFLDRLYQNPSKRAVDELFTFLEANMMPITDDGCFLAYKFVRYDYMDCYSNTNENKVGATIEMPRNQVCDDRDKTCSAGLHVCSLPYIKDFIRNDNHRALVVKVDPADVVSVPTDYQNTKMRTCRYTVVSELDRDKFDFDDEAFDGAFDTVVDREFTAKPTSAATYPDEGLSPSELGLKHGTITRHRNGDWSPSAPREADGKIGAAFNQYMAAYKKGFNGDEDFFANRNAVGEGKTDNPYDKGYADAMSGGPSNAPREADGKIGAAFNQYMAGWRAGLKAKAKSTPSSWPSDNEINDSNHVGTVKIYALGFKHGNIAYNRGERPVAGQYITRPIGTKYSDNTYYLTGYERGLNGESFSEYWQGLSDTHEGP